MDIKQAEKFLEVVEKMRKNNPKVEALYADVLNVYYPKVQTLPAEYLEVWDASLIARLRHLSGVSVEASKVERAVAYVPKYSGAPVPPILFGQLRIGRDFQGSATSDQQAIVGFPSDKVVGRPLIVVAGMMNKNELGADEIPVQVFRHAVSKTWVAVNNRGYATHCMAGLKPLRIWPRLPDQMEINRLDEVEGKDHARFFTYASGVEHLAKKPHTLPSLQIPITDGPNSWNVTAVVTVP